MSFLKNLLTGGKYNQLQAELLTYENLVNEYEYLEADYIYLNQTRCRAFQLLSEERTEVIKNLKLAKNLISRIKSIGKDKKQKIKSDFIGYYDSQNVEFSLGNVSIDFQGKLDNVTLKFLESVDSSFKRLESKNTYTKKDLKQELAIVGVTLIAEGINQLINLNSEVNQKRREIVESTKGINEAIRVISTNGPKMFAETKRILEITTVLNKHNQIFSAKYETIQKEINVKSKFSLFLDELFNKKIIPGESMQHNLHSLVKYSSEYSRFNLEAEV